MRKVFWVSLAFLVLSLVCFGIASAGVKGNTVKGPSYGGRSSAAGNPSTFVLARGGGGGGGGAGAGSGGCDGMAAAGSGAGGSMGSGGYGGGNKGGQSSGCQNQDRLQDGTNRQQDMKRDRDRVHQN